MGDLTLNLSALAPLTAERFYVLCWTNRDLRLELTARGELVVMAPAGGKSGNRNFNLTGQFYAWLVDHEDSGVGFDSSTGFVLPNQAIRSPDLAWLRRERWEMLTDEQREQFVPLCPDFVVELRSASDELKPLQEKLQEYIDNGARLGWLIDPQNQQVEIYGSGTGTEVLRTPVSLSAEPLLPGFVLDLGAILY